MKRVRRAPWFVPKQLTQGGGRRAVGGGRRYRGMPARNPSAVATHMGLNKTSADAAQCCAQVRHVHTGANPEPRR